MASPQAPERRQRLIDACRAWIVFESRKRPVLIAADDLQWTDGETRSLLWSVASLLHGARILLLVLTRPGGEQSVPGAAAHIRLQPLDASEGEQYLRKLMGDAAPSDAVLSEVVTRAGGNPLFLGEIARAFRDAGEWRAADVPPTVQAIIAARIDMLPADAKSLLQAASVLGHEFELDHLVVTAAAEPAQIRTTLGQLQAAGFIQELCVWPDASFGFDQPLVREVAYRGLVKDKRRALHQSAFHGLQAIKGHNCALHVGALAHHALAAGLWEQAARFCRLAGHRAARQSAYKEAASLYGSATEAAARLPDTPKGQRELIDIRLDRRHALFPLGRFAEIGRELELARSAAERLGDIARLGSVLLLETTTDLALAAIVTRSQPDRKLSRSWMNWATEPPNVKSCSIWFRPTPASASTTRPSAMVSASCPWQAMGRRALQPLRSHACGSRGAARSWAVSSRATSTPLRHKRQQARRTSHFLFYSPSSRAVSCCFANSVSTKSHLPSSRR